MRAPQGGRALIVNRDAYFHNPFFPPLPEDKQGMTEPLVKALSFGFSAP